MILFIVLAPCVIFHDKILLNFQNFDVKSLDLFSDYLYEEILELVDLDWAGKKFENTCRCFHLMPRFSRDLPGQYSRTE